MARPEARYVTSAEMAELLDAQEPPTTRLTDHRVRAGRKPAMRPVPRRNRHDRQGSRPEKPASDSRLRPQHGGQPYLTAARSEQVKTSQPHRPQARQRLRRAGDRPWTTHQPEVSAVLARLRVTQLAGVHHGDTLPGIGIGQVPRGRRETRCFGSCRVVTPSRDPRTVCSASLITAFDRIVHRRPA